MQASLENEEVVVAEDSVPHAVVNLKIIALFNELHLALSINQKL